MLIRDARESDLPVIVDIYNDAVVNTTAIWNDVLIDLENRMYWLDQRRQRGFPVLVAEQEGAVLGYASYGDWRAFDGYKHTVEHSVYVHKDARGKGTGLKLMEELLIRARAGKVHVMIAAIDASNTASIRLHEKLGFQHTGLYREVGTKFGRWLDLATLQYTFD
ncbi:GNAT family N-acetyltransferase [Martelella sp. HB161492]|uniref:GNAT family N-acetyltransferase n=1 Tax=Martelella sp. HB161492 TaxID=2720726 RepID=UPI0015907AB3|nr:GNAT family N-acetyltransferase [Martelella sp. HB161492]